MRAFQGLGFRVSLRVRAFCHTLPEKPTVAPVGIDAVTPLVYIVEIAWHE